MPELSFKGKEFVYNHHLAVPHRPLIPDAAKSIGAARLDGNLIIQGDNLHALKSLLPMYAGRVDCIFIDPPYNTGNEGWCYNDNVNSPMLQAWLKENPVGIEDGLRHDKWCAMMWPRLRLLHELLAETGSFWMTLDDNEIHLAHAMLDEIFGESRFVGIFVVVNNLKGRNDKENLALTHEYMLVYSKDEYLSRGLELTEGQLAEFRYQDGDGPQYALRDLRKRGSEDRKEDRRKMHFPIYWNKQSGVLAMERGSGEDIKILPKRGDGSDGRWRWGKDRVKANLANLVPREGASGRFDIDYKVFLNSPDDDEDTVRRKPKSTWIGSEFSTDVATTLIKNIFGENPLSHSPKPLEQVLRCIELSTGQQGIILDSFAGSATTAHAVLAANQKDGGNRKFILVECEDYADRLTAERVRRVIDGYAYTGTQRETLLKKNLTFTDLKKADRLLDQIAGIENLEIHRFDKIEKKVKDGVLTVEGVKAVAKKVDGLGGAFTYCTLGEAVDMDRLLRGEALPSFEQLGALLFHTATNEVTPSPPAPLAEVEGCGYLGESAIYHVWLIYKPELAFLQSREAALTLALARKLAGEKPGKRHLVFAPAKFVSQKLLDAERIPVEFAPLPWALYRVERG
ncbi:MAG: site-specific DNA-methyltransferase [Gammaproteobacteria bacterium]|nr:site-specific DNA-methyltransferase [Gammaproteobacteria bacterium]